jgi:hypothetical protein
MYKSIITAVLALALTWGCAKQVAQPENSTLPESVKSIAVLPVVATAGDEAKSPQPGNQLQNGIEALAQILTDYFAGNPKVTMLSTEAVDSQITKYTAGQLDQALAIGKSLKVEAVMLWDIKRFHERDGREYAVQSPASVAFDYRLVHTESGQTLCAGSFDETQKSITDNILSWRNLANRGFKWITATDLAREGVTKALSECKYLH